MQILLQNSQILFGHMLLIDTVTHFQTEVAVEAVAAAAVAAAAAMPWVPAVAQMIREKNAHQTTPFLL